MSTQERLLLELATPYLLSTARIEAFRENGFIKLQDVFSAHLLDHYRVQISDKVAELSADALPLEQRLTYGRAFLQIMNLWQESEAVQHMLLVDRWSTILGVIASIGTAYFAIHFPSIMDYVQALFSFFVTPLFGTVLLGMLWKRTTGPGAFLGSARRHRIFDRHVSMGPVSALRPADPCALCRCAADGRNALPHAMVLAGMCTRYGNRQPGHPAKACGGTGRSRVRLYRHAGQQLLSPGPAACLLGGRRTSCLSMVAVDVPLVEAHSMHERSIEIWFYIGTLLAVYGVVLTAAGMYQWIHPPPAVLASYLATFWAGIILGVIGGMYVAVYRPR